MGHIILFIVGLAIVVAMAWGILSTIRQRRSLDQAYQRENTRNDDYQTSLSEDKLNDIEVDDVPQSSQFTYQDTDTTARAEVGQGQDFHSEDIEPLSQIKTEKVSRAAEAGLIVVHVMAQRSKQFSGPELLKVFGHHKLVYGKKCIFHAYDRSGKVAFSVASAIEPGIFDLEHMQHFLTPGLGFFMDLRNTPDAREVFNRMLGVAKDISVALGGDILDEHYQRLSQASMADYLSRLQLAKASPETEDAVV